MRVWTYIYLPTRLPFMAAKSLFPSTKKTLGATWGLLLVSLLGAAVGLTSPTLAQDDAVTRADEPIEEPSADKQPVAAPAVASDSDKFHQGVQLLQNKKWPDAKMLFLELTTAEPTNTSVLYNLGLSAWELGEKGLAIGAWRKALWVDPHYGPALAGLKLGLKEVRPLSFEVDDDLLNSLRSLILVNLTLEQILWMVWLFGSVGIAFLLRHAIQRRKLTEDEGRQLGFPTVGVICSSFCVLTLALAIFKALDRHQPRGTIVSDNVPVLSGPQSSAPVLVEAHQGQEVLIHSEREEWSQISFPGGPAGWISKQNLFYSAGTSLW